MKKLFVLLLLSLSFYNIKAQFATNTDYGVFLGTAYYIGDINPSYHFDRPNISAGVMVRQNFNSRYSARTTLLYSQLSGADTDFDNAFKDTRAFSFNTSAIDFALSGEFNFVPFGDVDGKNKFTPYFTIGLGSTYFFTPDGNFFAFTIPFGVGGKIELSERITLALEWAPRKTFTDNIEGLGSPTFAPNSDYPGRQRFFTSDNDWFYSVGAYLTIKFWERKGKCRAYYGGSRR